MKTLGIIAAIGSAVVWGLVYTIDHKILVKLSPLTLLIVGSLVTLVVCIPLTLWHEPQALKTLLSSGKTTQVLLCIGALLVIAANYLILFSVKEIGAPMATILEISYPFFVIIFVALFFGAKVSLPFWIGTLLMFAGAATIIKSS